jgi:hypothetical protein
LHTLRKNWHLISFPDCHTTRAGERIAVVRHDVDLSLNAAVEMAEIESDESIAATYCIRLGGTYYDPLSISGIQAVRRLVELGHSIGLHFDITRYHALGLTADAGIDADIATLEHTFRRPVEFISQHSPARFDQPDLSERPDLQQCYSYNELFFDQMKYISDSGQFWREGDVEAHISADRIHMLTHPEWWTADGDDRTTILRNISARAQGAVSEKTDQLVDRYADYVADLERAAAEAEPLISIR